MEPSVPKSVPPWKKPKRWTLQACLLELGAPYHEVYLTDRSPSRLCPRCGRPMARRVKYKGRSRGTHHKRTIHQRFTGSELRDWVERLWKEAARWHPDRHQKRVRFYTAKFQEVSEAYHMAKRILRQHGRL